MIRFVLPGSLAAKHGLQANDEITAVNGVAFDRIEDAVMAFAQLRFDQGVRLGVRRKGGAVEVLLPGEVFQAFAGPGVKPAGKDQYEVLFRYKPAGTVTSVSLAGTFNDWNMKAQPLEGPDADGYYSTRVLLKKGTYEYKFVLDGKTWTADPTNLQTTGQHGNSLLNLSEMP